MKKSVVFGLLVFTVFIFGFVGLVLADDSAQSVKPLDFCLSTSSSNWQQGIVATPSGVGMDICLNNTALEKFSCGINNTLVSTDFVCPGGCFNGACVPTDPTVAKNQTWNVTVYQSASEDTKSINRITYTPDFHYVNGGEMINGVINMTCNDYFYVNNSQSHTLCVNYYDNGISCYSLNSSANCPFSDTANIIHLGGTFNSPEQTCSSQGGNLCASNKICRSPGKVVSSSDSVSGGNFCCVGASCAFPSQSSRFNVTMVSLGPLNTSSAVSPETGIQPIASYVYSGEAVNLMFVFKNNGTTPINASVLLANPPMFASGANKFVPTWESYVTQSGYWQSTNSEGINNVSLAPGQLGMFEAAGYFEGNGSTNIEVLFGGKTFNNETNVLLPASMPPSVSCSDQGGDLCAFNQACGSNGKVVSSSDSVPEGNFCCVGASCVSPNITGSPITPSLYAGPNGELSCTSGCLSNGKCAPVGYRTNSKYCNINGNFTAQISSGTCSNDFECTSNLCANSECISTSFLQRIINFFKNLFGISTSNPPSSGSPASASLVNQVNSPLTGSVPESKDISISPSSGKINLTRGANPAGFAFSVKNTGSKVSTFNYSLSLVNANGCDVTAADANSYVLNPSGSLVVKPDSTSPYWVVKFSVPASAPPCTLIYGFDVKNSSGVDFFAANISTTLQ